MYAVVLYSQYDCIFYTHLLRSLQLYPYSFTPKLFRQLKRTINQLNQSVSLPQIITFSNFQPQGLASILYAVYNYTILIIDSLISNTSLEVYLTIHEIHQYRQSCIRSCNAYNAPKHYNGRQLLFKARFDKRYTTSYITFQIITELQS